MADIKTFHLPDLGEGLPDATIVEWLVKEGGIVRLDEPLVSMETAKAVVEVPSPYSGKLVRTHGANGDVIATGAALAEFELDPKLPQRAEAETTGHHHAPPAKSTTPGKGAGSEAPDRKGVVASDEGGEIVENDDAGRADEGTVVGAMQSSDRVHAEAATSVGGIKAVPAVRALAKKLGVDIKQEANGVTYTQSHAGKTLFKIHASKVVQLRGDGRALLHDVQIELYGDDGKRVDRITGNEFEYDQKAGIAKATGPVEITIMRPGVAPAIAPILSGVAFDTASLIAANASAQDAATSLPSLRTYGRSRRCVRKPSQMKRVLSEIHSSFTWSFSRGMMRMTSRPRESTRIADPTASITSIDSVLFNSHGRAVKANGLEVSAPTGHRSTTLP